jgi:hypothetical protein
MGGSQDFTLNDGLGSVILLTGSLPAATWHILGDASTIQAGFGMAGRGDTVLVAAGTYHENVTMTDGVVLKSQAGRDFTNLRPATLGQSIITCTDLGPGTVIEGFSIELGEAYVGAAIYCLRSAATIIDNGFSGNNSTDDGGDILCVSCGGQDWPLIQGNLFHLNEAGGGGGGLFYQRTPTGEVRGNLFHGNESPYGGAICVGFECNVLIETNTFYGNSAGGMGASIQVTSGDAEILNCIIANSQDAAAIERDDGGTVTIDCNDLWANYADYADVTPGTNDFHEDPLFCDVDTGDFTLQDCSPCVEGYGCGQVGAYGVGCPCENVATRSTTWGSIKVIYR